jgi:septum site-determining protein MinD
MYSARTIADLLDLQLLGEIPEDPAVYVAQLRHKLIMDFDCDARKALIRISKRLQGQDVPFAEYGKKRISLFRYLFGSEVLEVKRRNEQKRKH